MFTSDGHPNNTVRVTGRRSKDSASVSIPLIFGPILGLNRFEPRAVAAATYIERDVVLVVDRSESMGGTQLENLKDAIDVFIDTLARTPVDEQVGLASYGEHATEDAPLTPASGEIASAMARLNTRGSLNTGGRTSISRGMEAGASIMSRGRNSDYVERTLIVMTDGIHNEGVEPRTVATSLANDGIKIHTITFGAQADQDRMIEVASLGGGQHFHAVTAEELVDAYREIASTLETMITE